LFRKILIANRGEIAVRVARTCRVMGIPTVAVYSEADRRALHVREADEAVLVGPAEAARSYLDIDALVGAARRTGADALHPGYGFLSENADFAEAVTRAGLTFIGPPPEVHRRMGDKQGARRLMAASGVPTVPGYDGDDQSDGALLAAATAIGWPVIIKPSRGGGGKGMRVARSAEDFASELARSRREARGAFGDDRMVLERYVERPRHVEVQVLADAQGRLVHLFERECSIQRRHQKIVEETPSPALTPERRAALCAAGVAAARAAAYVNAGTVEFLLAPDGAFYFLEINTRLQVEHPVTEVTTGLDLVRLQIEVAAGRPLPFAQERVKAFGHGLECRLYAEDPDHDDRPAPGRVLHFVEPAGPGIRCDSGIATGSEVTIHYDPMLAKVVARGSDRVEAAERMSAALRRTVVLGVATNLSRLQAIVDHPAFRAGALHTAFIEEHLSGQRSPGAPPPEAVAAAHAAVGARRRAPGSPDGAPDPWQALGAWGRGDGARAQDGRGAGSLKDVEAVGCATFAGRDGRHVETFHCVRDGDVVHLFWRGTAYRLEDDDEDARSAHRPVAGVLEAPMPGRVIAVRVVPGQAVSRGQELLVVEAMKMENALRAPRDGVVKTVAAKDGDMVIPGVVLVELE
jgi:3-methylcrotonyl-CoA carboxylase alpha subunit